MGRDLLNVKRPALKNMESLLPPSTESLGKHG